jgi:hypothetical protein
MTSMKDPQQDTLFGGGDKIDAIVRELHEVDGWPADEEKDRRFVETLMRQYPTVDLADEIKRWARWLLAHGTGKEVKSRGRYTRVGNWCSIAAGNGRGRRTSSGRLGGVRSGPPITRGGSRGADSRLGW